MSASDGWRQPGSQNSESGIQDELQDTFLQNVSHELRTPVTLIHGYAELLHDGDVGSLAPEQLKLVSVILNRTHELRGLVERISALLAVQAHATVKRSFALVELARRVVEGYRPALERAGLELETEFYPDLEPIWGDPYYIEQAIVCLLDNAAKFTPAGGRVAISVSGDDGWQSLSVTDTGIGISREEQERIFTRFHQVDGSATRRYQGVGLGLALARETIEEHGGHIELESAPGRGSRFTARLPVGSGLLDQGEPTPTPPSLRRILVVDDEESVALTFQCCLESLPNCEVVTATSAAQALSLVERQPFDLLVTDYRMPDMDGVTLASHVRQLNRATAVIMVTAYRDEWLRGQAAAVPIQRVMDKPVGVAEIRCAVSETLSGTPSAVESTCRAVR